MSHSARDTILNRLRNATARQSQQFSAEQITTNANALLENSPHASLADENPVTAFINRIESSKVIGTTCECLSSLEQLPTAVSNYLQENALGMDVAIQALPIFDALQWESINNTGPIMTGERDGLVAISFADFGIAETSSVVFHSGPNRPVLLNFWPLHLMVVLKSENIVKLLDDYPKQIDAITPPSKTVWITGASGTSDIEGVLVQGAHGPRQVHIFII